MITHINGDVTNPVGDDYKYIVHCCNNIGFWGAGVTKSITNKWVLPEIEYRKWYKKYVNENLRVLPLGAIQVVPVFESLPKVLVVNLIGQNGIYHQTMNPRPIVYTALSEGFTKLIKIMENQQDTYSIHMPRIGAGLAQGNWEYIESIIEHTFDKYKVYIYTL